MLQRNNGAHFSQQKRLRTFGKKCCRFNFLIGAKHRIFLFYLLVISASEFPSFNLPLKSLNFSVNEFAACWNSSSRGNRLLVPFSGARQRGHRGV